MARWFRRGLSVAGSFVCRCLTSPAMLRFHLPLIKPDVQISRIRLSDKESRLGTREPRYKEVLFAVACNVFRSCSTFVGGTRLTPLSRLLPLRTLTLN